MSEKNSRKFIHGAIRSAGVPRVGSIYSGDKSTRERNFFLIQDFVARALSVVFHPIKSGIYMGKISSSEHGLTIRFKSSSINVIIRLNRIRSYVRAPITRLI